MSIDNFSLDFFSLKNKTAIITGGNSGLGQAFSLALAKAGANLFIPSLGKTDPTFEKIATKLNVEIEIMNADITEDGAPRNIIHSCQERFGSVDILVNNAGICLIDDVQNFDRKKWDKMISVNLTAAFEMSYEASKIMMAQKSGKIINICSLFSYLGGIGSPAYAATKHGIAGLTKAYCDELAGHNIQVNGIAPGYFATEITTQTRQNPVTNQKVIDHSPTGRWGDPSELMGTCVFLASRAADFINGHILVVDGGYRVR